VTLDLIFESFQFVENEDKFDLQGRILGSVRLLKLKDLCKTLGFKGGPEPSILDDFCLGNVISKYSAN